MRTCIKTSLTLILLASLLSAIPVFAETSSPSVIVIDHLTVETATNNGQHQTPMIMVYDEDGEEVPEGKDCLRRRSLKELCTSPCDELRHKPLYGAKSENVLVAKSENVLAAESDRKLNNHGQQVHFQVQRDEDQPTKLHPAAVKRYAHVISSSNPKVIVDSHNRKTRSRRDSRILQLSGVVKWPPRTTRRPLRPIRSL